MPDLKPATALGDDEARSITHAALTLEEHPALALASVALRRNAIEPAPFGLKLPGPGQWTSKGAVSALWTGSGQWLLERSGQAEADFAADVRAACPGCSVTGQTDGFVAFRIRSSAGEAPILALMAKLVNLDLSRFAPGAGSRTELDFMSVFVIRRAFGDLAILGRRSSAATLWRNIETAIMRLPELPQGAGPSHPQQLNPAAVANPPSPIDTIGETI